MNELAFTAADIVYLGGLVVAVTSVIISNRNAVKTTDKKIDELTKKQDKYNNLQERVFKAEASTASAHHRITDNERRIEERLDSQHKDIKEQTNQLLTKFDKLIEQNNEHIEKYHMKG